jgi:hypothetical protein
VSSLKSKLRLFDISTGDTAPIAHGLEDSRFEIEEINGSVKFLRASSAKGGRERRRNEKIRQAICEAPNERGVRASWNENDSKMTYSHLTAIHYENPVVT